MNVRHLRAMLWMRWRILVNRIRRAGKLGNVLVVLLLLLVACVSAGGFALALGVGLAQLPEAEPLDVMLSWAALSFGFLFFWLVGLMTDLQQTNAMSLKSLLHLPVSLSWVFLYNYLSSFVGISTVLFVPAMVGLSVAMVIVHGPGMLLSLVLVAGFFVLVTALTYQLRGWLARVMENKRRGRNVIAALTVLFVLLLQVPNLVHIGATKQRRAEREERRAARVEEPHQEPREEDADERIESAAAKAATRVERKRAEREALRSDVDRYASLTAAVLPFGWLSYGVRAGMQGQWMRAWLCAVGMLSLAALSLHRSYRKTVASVLGAGSDGEAAPAEPETPAAPAGETARRRLLVERRLPWVPEDVAGIALANLRSLLRAPEAKTMLLSPIVVFLILGFVLAQSSQLSEMAEYAPLWAFGGMSLGLLSSSQLLQNQFGLDRQGFRAYVLSPSPRYVLLRGKNLGTAPFGVGVGLVALVGLQFFVPLDVTHFLGGLLQLLSAYLILCLIGNTFSVLAPIRLKLHGVKAANVKLKTVVQQVFSVFLVPVLFAPLLVPYGVELLLDTLGWGGAGPAYLLLHGLLFAAVAVLYRWLTKKQGVLLQSQEKRILEELTRD